MCLILFACHKHPDYPLILAANRDEFHARPAQVAQWWNDSPDLLAGQDLSAGGTWLGITRSGRFAAITNYRDPSSHKPSARSRGELTTNYLREEVTPENYQNTLQSHQDNYNGYNLLYGSLNKLYYFSNRGGSSTALLPGIYGLSNHLLDTPWPKVRKGKRSFAKILQQQIIEPAHLWPILEDSSVAPDNQLPETGIGLDLEKTLSSIRIAGDHYGTRNSTLLLVRKGGEVHFCERTYISETQETEKYYRFKLKVKG